MRGQTADRGRLGVDEFGFPAVPGVPGLAVPGVLGGVLGPEYKVLRGGSFAVSRVASRGTFRNWDYPIRRQIFAGFRTARSATLPRGDPPIPETA